MYVFHKTPRQEVLLFPLCFARNTFVLEYCGEVLDHKEFKARVKEYARNKNIHYYFMALKNDEVSSMNVFALKQIGKLLSLKGSLNGQIFKKTLSDKKEEQNSIYSFCL